MLLLFFSEIASTGISAVIAETGDSVALRVGSAAATIIDPHFRIVASPRLRTLIPASTKMQKFDSTTPEGRLLLSVDFSRLLPPDVIISSASVTIAVHELSAADDFDVADRLDGAAIVSVDQTTISQWFQFGLDDVDYVLTFIANLADGEIVPVAAEMSVRRYS